MGRIHTLYTREIADGQVGAAADALNALTAEPAASKRITLPFIGR